MSLKRPVPVTCCTACGNAGYNLTLANRRCGKNIGGERCEGTNAPPGIPRYPQRGYPHNGPESSRSTASNVWKLRCLLRRTFRPWALRWNIWRTVTRLAFGASPSAREVYVTGKANAWASIRAAEGSPICLRFR